MSFQGVRTFHHQAMATEWRLFLPEATTLDASEVARAVFAMLDRLEMDLSRFEPSSYVSRLGRLAAGEVMVLNATTFHCLAVAKALYVQTGGAFDITVRSEPSESLKRSWNSSMEAFVLDPDTCQIQTLTDHLALDLGGVGKGFAVDEIAQWLETNAVQNAFVDAGASTMFAMGSLPGASGQGWPVSVGHDQVCALCDRALAASGFEAQGRHIIDPRSGIALVTDRRRSWVFADSAAVADGLSTATLVMSHEEIERFSRAHPDVTVMIL